MIACSLRIDYEKHMTNLTKLRIGTRKSALALAQAHLVAEAIVEAWPELAEPGLIEVIPIQTSGDKFTDRPLTDLGGKGLFTKELEEALLDGGIDIAVHSMKDMPTILPDGLTIGCMLEREDPRDMLLGTGLRSLMDIPHGASFGTSSLRRAAQILMKRPDLNIVPFRGNVQTRLNKLESGEVQSTMLAMAGLNRLGLWDVPGHPLNIDEFLPAIAQGAIGVECREGDTDILETLSPIAHIETETAVQCERAFLQTLDGSCRTPIAGFASVEGPELQFRGLILRPNGSEFYEVTMQGPSANAEGLGIAAGEDLLKKAGKNFLNC